MSGFLSILKLNGVGFREKKKAIGIIVLGLLFISAPSYADDIRDFQIEGMSIADSALDYFRISKILIELHD